MCQKNEREEPTAFHEKWLMIELNLLKRFSISCGRMYNFVWQTVVVFLCVYYTISYCVFDGHIYIYIYRTQPETYTQSRRIWWKSSSTYYSNVIDKLCYVCVVCVRESVFDVPQENMPIDTAWQPERTNGFCHHFSSWFVEGARHEWKRVVRLVLHTHSRAMGVSGKMPFRGRGRHIAIAPHVPVHQTELVMMPYRAQFWVAYTNWSIYQEKDVHVAMLKIWLNSCSITEKLWT